MSEDELKEWLDETIGSLTQEEKVSMVERIVERVNRATSETLDDLATFDRKILDTQFQVVPK